jgi:glycosyltransferase involved in cell wall biosynthesis
MKVLMMHRDEGLAGGAQIQMNRLRAGLIARGVDARLMRREGSNPDSVAMPYHPRVERCVGAITRRAGLNDVHLLSSFGVARLPAVRNADVLDLHCLHSGTFSYLALPSLCAVRPVVFTFHDMWPITGHCHASLECGRWKTGCGNCPHLDVDPPIRRDGTSWEWKLKQRSYARAKFTIVTPSLWLAKRVGESMLADREVHHIPHGVDTGVFRALEKTRCREMLGIPGGKSVLLCAMEYMSRPLKGADLLVKALNCLPEDVRKNSVLLMFGKTHPSMTKEIRMEHIDLGYIAADALKAVAYSAADLLINPSRAESFGLVALEAMACGTPVMAFRVGGIPEQVRPGETGDLAEPEDAAGLAAAVARWVMDPVGLQRLGQRCRSVVETEYSLDLQVRRSIGIYQKAASDFNNIKQA